MTSYQEMSKEQLLQEKDSVRGRVCKNQRDGTFPRYVKRKACSRAVRPVYGHFRYRRCKICGKE